MLIELVLSDDRPIYTQIAEQVTFAVAAGVLRPGDLVPSVRELSKQLVVNPNTVARAYRELQLLGIVEPVRGTGLQVTLAAGDRCLGERREIVRRRLRGAIEEAMRSELAISEIEAIFHDEWAKANGHGNGRVRGGEERP